jgi:outer membrane protein TolC
LQAARAARRLAGFDQFPTVTFAGGYSHILDSKQQLPFYNRHDREFDSAQSDFDGLWELDLFGRVRRNVEAARADLGASAATLRDARVSVIAEVARDYFILRGLQDQLALTMRNADNQLNTAKLTRTRLEAGRGNELDTARAEAQWQTTLASIPALQASIATTTYRLSVLTGRQPTALGERLSPQAPMPSLPTRRPPSATSASATRSFSRWDRALPGPPSISAGCVRGSARRRQRPTRHSPAMKGRC